MQKNFRNNSPYFIFQIIARLYTAEQPPEILVNDCDDSEMESGNLMKPPVQMLKNHPNQRYLQ